MQYSKDKVIPKMTPVEKKKGGVEKKLILQFISISMFNKLQTVPTN